MITDRGARSLPRADSTPRKQAIMTTPDDTSTPEQTPDPGAHEAPETRSAEANGLAAVDYIPALADPYDAVFADAADDPLVEGFESGDDPLGWFAEAITAPSPDDVANVGDALAALDPASLLLLGLLDAIDQLTHDLHNAQAEIAALLERPWFLDPPRDLDAETCAGWIIGKAEAAARAGQPLSVVVLPARVEALLAGTIVPAYGFASYRLLDVVHVRTQPTAIRFATC